MREIKYRGFHIKLNRMFSAEDMAIDQLTLLTTGKFINVHGRSTELSTIFPLDIFIPLQYTGLIDKNGIEIYEGDIVYRKMEQGGQYKVVKWDLTRSNCGFNIALPMTTMQWEVVGNIYQNPELTEWHK